jgi:hypothetical protein
VKTTFFKTLGVVFFVLLIYVSILNYLRAPIQAEYWVRELMIIKHSFAKKIDSRKIILVGGSSVLFGIDADQIERSLGIPCLNYGLHAAMRLEWLLEEVKEVAKPGDIIIIALEPAYYTRTSDWNEWQLRNSIAWNNHYIEKQSTLRKILIYINSGTLDIALDLIKNWFANQSKNPPEYINKRNLALLPDNRIIQNLLPIGNKAIDFPFYRKMQIDDHGTALAPDVSEYNGDFVPLNFPSTIAAYPKALLEKFISDMKELSAKVYFVNAPYGCNSKNLNEHTFQKQEDTFKKEVQNLGSQVIDKRWSLLMGRDMFFDTSLHLNQKGKYLRTECLIKVLRQKVLE